MENNEKYTFAKPHGYEIAVNRNGRIVKLTNVRGAKKENMERRYGSLWAGV